MGFWSHFRVYWYCGFQTTFIFQTFRRLLISKLQDEFENRARNVEGKRIICHVTGLQYALVCPALSIPIVLHSL